MTTTIRSPFAEGSGSPTTPYAESRDGQVRIAFEVITPAAAKRYLEEANTNNRSLSNVLAASYAKDMQDGRWYLNTAGIGFDINGVLLDGQHRLEGIVRSGVAIELPVFRGLPPESRQTIDVGRKRTVGDELKMRGITNNNTLAAAVRLRLQYENNTIGLSQKVRISNPEVIEWADVWNTSFQNAIRTARQVYQSLKVSTMTLACCYSIFHSIDPDLTEHYYDKLYTGAGLEVGNPIHTVRERLRNHDSRFKLTAPQTMWILIRGWNAVRKGESYRRVILPDVVSGKSMIQAI